MNIKQFRYDLWKVIFEDNIASDKHILTAMEKANSELELIDKELAISEDSDEFSDWTEITLKTKILLNLKEDK